MNMPPPQSLRFFAIGSTKIPLLTELKMMNAIPVNDFTHDVFLSHSSKDKTVMRTLSLSDSIPFSASDGEKVAKPDEVFPVGEERTGVRCRSLHSLRADGPRV